MYWDGGEGKGRRGLKVRGMENKINRIIQKTEEMMIKNQINKRQPVKSLMDEKEKVYLFSVLGTWPTTAKQMSFKVVVNHYKSVPQCGVQIQDIYFSFFSVSLTKLSCTLHVLTLRSTSKIVHLMEYK